MEYRRLGRSGLQVSALSFGAWVTFGKQIGDPVATKLLHTAYDSGINFFDNAEAYADGRAELVMGDMPGRGLVLSCIFYNWGLATVYATAIYERTLFDKPLAHAALFDAILRAKARGQRRFLLGEVPPVGTASDKETSIGFFKAGFTDRIEAGLDWDWRLA